ncbi:MAG: iron export ABC transporter permease subunit FetB [Proteobacteria bacterium]|nr:iron export ABC transporter permease subunit FetB [Pseudomonadota bacterium]
MTTVTLDAFDLALAALLVVLNAGLSFRLGLALEKPLLVAAVRTAVQLFLVGFVIKALFALASPLWTGLMVMVMVLAAGYEVHARQTRRFTGVWAYGLGTLSVAAGAGLVTLLALVVVVQPEPWYHPRYAIPLLGMILGNAMTAVSLALDSLATAAARERVGIEARLALGADRATALRSVSHEALRTGMMPIINAMSAAGVIALPGMMTGQILAGVDPVDAVQVQIAVMYLVLGSVATTTVVIALGVSRRLFTTDHRLVRIDRPAP